LLLSAQRLRDYSTLLYGAPDVIDVAALTVLWPALIPASVLQHMSSLCAPPKQSQHEPVPYVFPGGLAANFQQAAALWLHRPTAPGPFDDHSWAEVTHCGYHAEGVNSLTPMWFMAAVGSGVRINVGRSVRMPELRLSMVQKDLRNKCRARSSEHCPGVDHYDAHQVHQLLIHPHGQLDKISRLLGVNDIRYYDSVQFPSRSIPSWRGSVHTEIIMLNWFSENDYLAQHVSEAGLRCGPPSRMRPCRADEPAMQQQAHGVCDAQRVWMWAKGTPLSPDCNHRAAPPA